VATLNTYDEILGEGAENLVVTEIAASAATYRVFDFAGDVVALGDVDEGEATIPAPTGDGWLSGWYLALFEAADWNGSYGYVADSLQVTVFRDGVAPMPPVPAVGAAGSAADPNARLMDLPLHWFTRMGPTLHQIGDAVNPDDYTAGVEQGGTITAIAANVAYERSAGGGYNASHADPERPEILLLQFPTNLYTETGYAAGVTETVDALGPGTASNIAVFEGLNEPEGEKSRTVAQSAAQYVAFRAAVKAGHADALAAGPCEVAIGPGVGLPMSHLDDWLTAVELAGHRLDFLTLHNYNSNNGDWRALDGWLSAAREVLADHEYPPDLPFAYTENGFMGMRDWGVFDVRRGVQWAAIMLVTGERFGVPKEHQFWFYDTRRGGDPISCWLKESTGDLAPYATLFRVYGEEVYGTSLEWVGGGADLLDFGEMGDAFFRGNVQRGPGKGCVVLLAQGTPGDTVTLSVSDAGPLTCSDWQGRTSTLSVVDGVVTVPVGSLPTYLRVSEACTVGVVESGGLTGAETNAALDATPSTGDPEVLMVERVNDGVLRTGGYLGTGDEVFTTHTPDHVTLTWDEEVSIDHVLLRQMPPWMNFPAGTGASAMAEGRLEYWNGSGWLPAPTVPGSHWNDRGRYLNDTAESFLGRVGGMATRVQFYDHHWNHDLRLSVPIKTTRLRFTLVRSSVGILSDAAALAASGLGSTGRLMLSQFIAIAGADDPGIYGPLVA
jgi:hypothetical protein